MSFVIVSDHDRVRHCLSNNLVCVVLDGKDNLKSELLVLMPAIASDTHRKLNLPGSLWKRWQRLRGMRVNTVSRILCRFGPLFDLICVEYNHTPLFVLLKHFLLIWLLLFLSRSSLSLSLYTAGAYLDFSSIQRLLFVILGGL